MHAGEINLHRLINADRALDRQLRAPAPPPPPPPSFCVGNLQRRQTAFSCRREESERQESGGGSRSQCGGKRGREGRWARVGAGVERWLAHQEPDSPLIGSIGHCQRRIFSCWLTGRAIRMIAHLSAQKTNKNKPLLI